MLASAKSHRWTVLAIAFILVAVAALFVGPLRVLHAEHAVSQNLLIYFQDNFENPGVTATQWLYGSSQWATALDRANQVMRGSDPGGGGMLAACNGRSFLGRGMTLSVRLRIDDAGTATMSGPGVAWCVSDEQAPLGQCYGVMFCPMGGLLLFAPDTTLAGVPFAVEQGRWYDLRVVTTDTAIRVWVDGVLILESANPGAGGEGAVCLHSNCVTSFDDVSLQARPSRPGRLLGATLDLDYLAQMIPCIGLYVLEADGSQGGFLTGAPGSVDLPCDWSPDGSRVAFTRETQSWSTNEHLGMYVMETDGSGLVGLSGISAPPEADEHAVPRWSPDGQWLVFETERDGNSEVYRIRPDGGGAINLTNHPSRDEDPCWSPDGMHIAFVSNRSGFEEIWVMDADGGNPRQLTQFTGAPVWDLDWSPDGSRLAFGCELGGRGDQIYTLREDGTDLVQVTSFPSDWKGDPGWSPDGRKLAFTAEWESQFLGAWARVYVVNADGSSLFAVTPMYVDAPPFGTIEAVYVAGPWDPTEPPAPRQISLPSLPCAPGAAITVPIYVTPVRGVGALQVDLRFDAGMLTPTQVTLGELVTGLPGWEVGHQFDPGRVQFMVYCNNAVPVYGGSGPIAYVTFTVNPEATPGTASALHIAGAMLCDEWGEPLPVDRVWDGMVTASIAKGDVNGDRVVNVLDVMKTVNFILGNLLPAPWQAWAADANSDGDINVLDILVIINTAFQDSGSPRPAAAPARRDPIALHVSRQAGAVRVWTNDGAGLAGFQFDLVGVQGNPKVAAGSLLAGQGWTVFAQPMGDRMRIVAFSNTGTGLPDGKGDLVTIGAGGQRMPGLENVVLGDAAGRSVPVK